MERTAVASTPGLLDLLHILVRSLSRVYIVLDRIDECSDYSSLVRDLVAIMQQTSTRLIQSSRQNVGILRRTVPKAANIAVEKPSVRQDIRLYLRRNIGTLIREDILPSSDDANKLMD